MQSLISLDRSGAPFVAAGNLEVQLLPVLKAQLEAFGWQPNDYSNAWYETLLETNGQMSWRAFDASTREQVFATGLLPDEGCAFASWLGDGARLPTLAELQGVHEQWSRQTVSVDELLHALGRVLQCERLFSLFAQVIRSAAGETLSDKSLMHGGVLEWVQTDSGWQCVGQPRQTFLNNTFNWDCPIWVSAESRHKARGIRLVRPRAEHAR